jgi:hypothetical protein
MLAFIMSKMQMLLFAVGVGAILVMFMMFISNMGLKDVAGNQISLIEKSFSRVSSNDIAYCAFDSVMIPSKLSYGNGTNNFYYEMRFKVITFNSKQSLVISINEYKKPNPIASKLIPTDAKEIILLDEDILGLQSITSSSTYGSDELVVYPRSSYKSGSGAPNTVSFVRKRIDGDVYLYVIPSSSFNNPNIGINDAQFNVIKTGCYELKITPPSGDLTENSQINSCFNVTSERIIDWKYCKNNFGYT